MTQDPAHSPALTYRPEIDGLRSIAVVPVILFHAGLSVFSGGFVGVDVFFVISGYLITSILLREMAQGKFSLGNFYERRARRILPALFVVIAVSFGLAWYGLEPKAFVDFAESVIAVNLFASNFLFWSEANYFDTATELKPLLHTWSLAVEEQFYIFFPLLLMGLWRFGLRVITTTLILIFIGSLALSEHQAVHSPTANFYLLPTRAWELIIGCFCALWVVRSVTVPALVAQLLSALGLGMILCAVFYFDGNTPFPSLAALVPTLGTAMVIVFATSQTITARLLSLRPFVALGLVSYSAYLWHQPLIAFAKVRNFGHLSYSLIAVLVIASFVLAAITYFLVERPARRKSLSIRKLLAILIPTGVISVLLAGLVIYKEGYPHRVDGVYSDEARAYEKSLLGTFRNDSAEGSDLPIVLIVGDSYVTNWSIGLRSIIDESKYRVISISYLGCDVTSGTGDTLFDVSITAPIFTAYCKPFEKHLNDPKIIQSIEHVIWTNHRPFEYASNLFRFEFVDALMARAPQARLTMTESYFQMKYPENSSCVSVMFTAKSDARACMERSVYPDQQQDKSKLPYFGKLASDYAVLDPIALFCEADRTNCPFEAEGVPFIYD